MRKFDEALVCYEKALALQPDHPHALNGLIWCANSVCDFGRRASFSADAIRRASERGAIISPFQVLTCSGDASLLLQCATNYSAKFIEAVPRPLYAGETRRHEKVRIAYLSADFREHPVGYLMADLFERHDRSQFEVIAASFAADDASDLRKRLVRAFDQFHDIRERNDLDAARLLHGIEADIVIDLMGHTKDSRPKILSYRPAPVQASYLGYPGTIGTASLDYIIADETVAPFEHQAFYAEKIVHLPDCYFVSDPNRHCSARVPSRREAGLPETGFVFCCFNQSWKITPEIFDVWMRLLHAVEGSLLWLRFDNESAERNLRKEAQARGINPVRLVFARRLPASEDHLARHHLADLFLDTLPYNAHTTASDALWMGLPVLTSLGQTFAGRAAASMLNAIGLPELVTRSVEDYEALALRLAQDPVLLDGYRQRLKANRLSYPLFDAERFRRHIEAAYLQMWEIWQRGEQPRSFRVAASGMCIPQ